MGDEPPVDELFLREARPWTVDKLAVIEGYLEGFGKACKRAGRWFYVDAFAGSGVNVVKETQERIWGSAMIGLRTEPQFTRCLLLAHTHAELRALAERARPFGDRAVVRRGDANTDLMPLMGEHVDPHCPAICLLDPEGLEVNWATIRAISRFRRGGKRVEQLIYFTPDGAQRVMPLYTTDPGSYEVLWRFWEHDDWKPILERRQNQELGVDEARTEYVKLYAAGLRRLGYEYVLNREIRERSREGAVKYFLLFATDDPTGNKIMTWCFDRIFPREEQLYLPGFEPPTSRDLRG